MTTATMAQKAEPRVCGRNQETEVLRGAVRVACYRKNVGLRLDRQQSPTPRWDIVFPGPVLLSVKWE